MGLEIPLRAEQALHPVAGMVALASISFLICSFPLHTPTCAEHLVEMNGTQVYQASDITPYKDQGYHTGHSQLHWRHLHPGILLFHRPGGNSFSQLGILKRIMIDCKVCQRISDFGYEVRVLRQLWHSSSCRRVGRRF